MKKIKLSSKLALNKVKVTELNNENQMNIVGGEKDTPTGINCLNTNQKKCWITEAPSGCGACWSIGVPCGTGITCPPSKD